MMRAVGHPVAVNPDRELERVAREEGWRIMRFDKLGRRLRWAAAVASVALVGGGRRLRGRAGTAAAAPAPPAPALAVAPLVQVSRALPVDVTRRTRLGPSAWSPPEEGSEKAPSRYPRPDPARVRGALGARASFSRGFLSVRH